MPREIFGNELPPIEESKVSDIFHNIITNEIFVFDNGEWKAAPEEPDPSLPTPSIADAGKAVVVGEDGRYELGEVGGGGGEESVLKCVGNFDAETGNITLDKTYAEIIAAVQGGKMVFVNVQIASDNVQSFFICSVELLSPYIIVLFGGANSMMYSAEVASTSDYPVFSMD